jgi:hypothetical protein
MKRVIAFSWAVEPLALSVGLPPQATLAVDALVVALPPVALLSPPHADKSAAPVARTTAAAPNRLSARETARFLAAMRHSNKIAPRPRAVANPTARTLWANRFRWNRRA